MTLPVKKMIASDSVSNNPCSFCSIGKLVAACDQEIENEYHYLYRGVKLVFVGDGTKTPTEDDTINQI